MDSSKFRNRIFNQSFTESWPVPDESIDLIITSPPYWHQRDNGESTKIWWTSDSSCDHKNSDGYYCPDCGGIFCQLGQEKNPSDYVSHLVHFLSREALRVLTPGGQMWINIGDTYSRGIKGIPYGESGQRLLIPYRVAIALQDQGWVLRNELIWAKGVLYEDNTTKGGGMPSAVHDRLNHCHEVFFGFVKPHTKRKPYYISRDSSTISWNPLPDSNKISYFSDLNPLRVKPTWVNESGERVDFYGRVMGSADNAGGSPKQHSLSQPNLYIQNHPAGKNPGSVWLVKTDSLTGQKIIHTAPYPKTLINRIIKFGSPICKCNKCGLPLEPVFDRETKSYITPKCECEVPEPISSVVFDPFMGSGTTAIAAIDNGRDFSGLEMNPEYFDEATHRTAVIQKTLNGFF